MLSRTYGIRTFDLVHDNYSEARTKAARSGTFALDVRLEPRPVDGGRTWQLTRDAPATARARASGRPR